MAHPFDPGYIAEPFLGLCTDYPGADVYPADQFRIEWGPIFHRGRLDGSARVLVIGQDPGQHENVLRRILAGEAGRRVQGFLAKLGIVDSYVLINALLYSVASSQGASYVNQPAVQAYRDSWLDAILAPGKVEAVVTFGTLARDAWRSYEQILRSTRSCRTTCRRIGRCGSTNNMAIGRASTARSQSGL